MYIPHTYCIAYKYVVYPIRWQTSRATPSACRAATGLPFSGTLSARIHLVCIPHKCCDAVSIYI